MRLVCPSCGTEHRVSVAQGSYRRLPCRNCGEPIPLTVSRPLPAGTPAGRVSQASDRTRVHHLPEPASGLFAEPPDDLAGVALPQPSDDRPGARADAARLPCPLCGQPVLPGARKCPHCRGWIATLTTAPADAGPARPGRLTVWLLLLASALALALLAWLRTHPGGNRGAGETPAAEGGQP